MGWLVAVAATLTLAVVGFAVAVSVVVMRERQRRRPHTDIVVVGGADGPAAPDSDEEGAADFVQFWMDNQWDQRFG